MELETYKLEDTSSTWYKIIFLGQTTGATPLKWYEFTKLFIDTSLYKNIMLKYATQF